MSILSGNFMLRGRGRWVAPDINGIDCSKYYALLADIQGWQHIDALLDVLVLLYWMLKHFVNTIAEQTRYWTGWLVMRVASDDINLQFNILKSSTYDYSYNKQNHCYLISNSQPSNSFCVHSHNSSAILSLEASLLPCPSYPIGA